MKVSDCCGAAVKYKYNKNAVEVAVTARTICSKCDTPCTPIDKVESKPKDADLYDCPHCNKKGAVFHGSKIFCFECGNYLELPTPEEVVRLESYCRFFNEFDGSCMVGLDKQDKDKKKSKPKWDVATIGEFIKRMNKRKTWIVDSPIDWEAVDWKYIEQIAEEMKGEK